MKMVSGKGRSRFLGKEDQELIIKEDCEFSLGSGKEGDGFVR
jgi:hypothetical protein